MVEYRQVEEGSILLEGFNTDTTSNFESRRSLWPTHESEMSEVLNVIAMMGQNLQNGHVSVTV